MLLKILKCFDLIVFLQMKKLIFLILTEQHFVTTHICTIGSRTVYNKPLILL